MHFSQNSQDNGSKLTKIAIVTALHLAVGSAIINNMGHHGIGKMIQDKLDVVFIVPKVILPPPPPPEPVQHTKTKTMTEAKRIVTRPPIEHEVPATNTEPTITAAVSNEVLPPDTGPRSVEPAVARPASDGGAMRTAVLAEGCAKPDYPARSARNGDSGTVNLALLVGSDGKVADARIQKSSGYRELDRAAIAALSMCKFKAATNGGVSEQGWAQIAYVWTLEQ